MTLRTLFLIFGVVFAEESHAATALSKSGKWSLFQSVRDGHNVCWIATAVGKINGPQRGLFLYVTKRKGKTPEISIVVSRAVQNARKISLTVADQTIPFTRRGNAAWPSSKSDDNKLIRAFQKADQSGSPEILIKWNRKRNWISNAEGFSKAYSKNIETCRH